MGHSPVYLNSTTKTVIKSEFNLDKSFQEVLYRIDNKSNEGSGWMIESINGEYGNISMYSPLMGSTYIELPDKLFNPMKRLIKFKNNDNKLFLWCHIRHLNLVKIHPGKITKQNREMTNDLDYEGIEFPFSKKDYCKIERQNNICINVFCYENGLTYPVYVSDQKFGDSMDLLMITDEISLIMCISKILTDLCAIKQKIKTKNIFASVVYNVLVVKIF